VEILRHADHSALNDVAHANMLAKWIIPSRRGASKVVGSGLIEHDSTARIRWKRLRECASIHHIDPERFKEIVVHAVDRHRAHVLVLPRALRENRHRALTAVEQVAALRDVQDLRIAQQSLFQCGVARQQILAPHVERDDLLLIEPQLFRLYELHLTGHDEAACDQGNGDRKLEHDERLAEPCVRKLSADGALQHARRLEAGREDGRIQPRDRAYEHGHANEHRPPGEQIVSGKRHLPSYPVGRDGDGTFEQPSGQEQRNAGQQHRLAQELPDQIRAMGPQRFPHAGFPRPLQRIGRRQVHVIEAGQQQNEYGNAGEAVDVRRVARTEE